jgi:hypothetical protein
MKTIREIYDGFIRLRRDAKKGTFNIGTYEEIAENNEIVDHTGCKLLISEILEKRPARGNFKSTRPMVYIVKAKITFKPERKVE